MSNHYSFQDIEAQAKQINKKTQAVLDKDFQKNSTITKSVTVLALSTFIIVTGVFISTSNFNNQDNFSADLTQVKTEAQSIDIKPVSLVEEEEKVKKDDAVSLSLDLDNKVTKKPSTNQAKPSTTKKEVVKVAQTPKELNPFTSIVNQQNKQNKITNKKSTSNNIYKKTETVHGSAFTEKATEIKNKIISPFKENKHTVEKVKQVQNKEIKDPLKDITSPKPTNTLALPVKNKVINNTPNFDNNQTMFTGQLLKSNTQNTDYTFNYTVALEDGRKVQLNTSRNLENIIGKNISIEIEGTIDNFVLKHLYYKPQNTLPQTGPIHLLLISILLSAVATFLVQRKVNFLVVK